MPNFALALDLPWVEKYRPHKLDDIVGNEETIERLKLIVQDGNMPHMIILGLPGIGKTTSVHCLAYELLGPDLYLQATLELNASDDRGIDVVRNKIKQFAQTKILLPPGRHKIVILDEADSMTPGAQQALRRTMELYSNTTRFAFACNQLSKIIEPLQSRCAILRYNKLADDQVLLRLLEVAKAELSTVAGFGFVDDVNVFKIVDQPHPLVVKKILGACILDRSVDDAIDLLDTLWRKGYSAIDIVTLAFRVAKTLPGISELKRLDVIKEIGFVHMRVLEGVLTYLQLCGMLAKLALLDA
ncbi:hypothetical protein HF325_004509 [Metschnikowia pulcherrima]|uniref:AAA+ ATPase domain-containing protein n=1 Tax=Metschnikowia pulcherrima TaxID=27326 RepID=A0A8H7LAR7_9ASCO|nr:hypothetical protein HF325_004509 [Metschnikowia pulcherrima]